MRVGLVTLMLVLQAAQVVPAQAQLFPGNRMNGVDPEVRRLLESDEPVGFAARCVVSQVRASWLSTSQEERRRFEQAAAGLTAAMPAIGEATGVPRGVALGVFGLATMPLATFSAGLMPGVQAKADPAPTKECVQAGADPDAYVAGLAKR